jgi:ABC-type lipoprotein export system ATPase subunit
MTAFIDCDTLVKIYKVADLEVVALQGLDLHVRRGEMLALVGASGSGKSTLLNILGGLDSPSAGRCTVGAYDLTKMGARQRTDYRRRVIGHVWQQTSRNVLADLTAEENVEMPLVLSGWPRGLRARRAQTLLRLVGLEQKRQYKPVQLSGGEQQRVAIAVALANNPPLLLADEPTGELDSRTAETILALLRQLNQELGMTMVLVTHDAAVARAVDRTIAMRDGRTSTEMVRQVVEVERAWEGLDGAGTLEENAAPLLEVRHQESVIIDKVGRLQIPAHFLEALPFHGRAEIRLADGHLEVWPLGSPANAAQPGNMGSAQQREGQPMPAPIEQRARDNR